MDFQNKFVSLRQFLSTRRNPCTGCREGRGREGTYMRRTFTGRIVFDTSELRKLLSHSQSKAAVDVRGICPSSQCTFINLSVPLLKGMLGWHTYRRGLLRCSFYYDGQCEGLEVWDE